MNISDDSKNEPTIEGRPRGPSTNAEDANVGDVGHDEGEGRIEQRGPSELSQGELWESRGTNDLGKLGGVYSLASKIHNLMRY